MLTFAVESETEDMGSDPDTNEAIVATLYFVTATDREGRKWRHCESFSTLYEDVNAVGEVVHRKNRRAHKDAKELMQSLIAAKLASVEANRDWSEE